MPGLRWSAAGATAHTEPARIPVALVAVGAGDAGAAHLEAVTARVPEVAIGALWRTRGAAIIV